MGPQAVPIPAARKSVDGQPDPLHGSLVQHPRKVGVCSIQVYLVIVNLKLYYNNWTLSTCHFASGGQVPMSLTDILD